jgi:hypothetical protein
MARVPLLRQLEHTPDPDTGVDTMRTTRIPFQGRLSDTPPHSPKADSSIRVQLHTISLTYLTSEPTS